MIAEQVNVATAAGVLIGLLPANGEHIIDENNFSCLIGPNGKTSLSSPAVAVDYLKLVCWWMIGVFLPVMQLLM